MYWRTDALERGSYYLSPGQAVSFTEDEGLHPIGQIFPERTIYGGQAEEKRAFQTGRPPLF